MQECRLDVNEQHFPITYIADMETQPGYRFCGTRLLSRVTRESASLVEARRCDIQDSVLLISEEIHKLGHAIKALNVRTHSGTYEMTLSERLDVTLRHAIYPGIAPDKLQGAAKGKVVLITGASQGIGEATARSFASSGANIFLIARSADLLEQLKGELSRAFPASVIDLHVADVTKSEQVKEAVDACVTKFGQIDVVIASSGVAETLGTKISEADPEKWWYTWEVNVKGCFLVAHYTLPHLVERKGYLIFVSSAAAQNRTSGWSSYSIGKHSLNRIAEFVEIEHGADGVKAFSFNPGGIKTGINRGLGIDHFLIDDMDLPAWTMVRLTTGSEDYLSGRYVSATWDLDEVESKWKEAIMKGEALKNRLVLPVL